MSSTVPFFPNRMYRVSYQEQALIPKRLFREELYDCIPICGEVLCEELTSKWMRVSKASQQKMHEGSIPTFQHNTLSPVVKRFFIASQARNEYFGMACENQLIPLYHSTFGFASRVATQVSFVLNFNLF